MYHGDAVAIQYVSAVLSYLSLCYGVVEYDSNKKAERKNTDTRLEWLQYLSVFVSYRLNICARFHVFFF